VRLCEIHYSYRKFLANELFDIGSRCMDNNNTCGALHYMLRAKELFEVANDVDSLMMTLEHLVDLMEQVSA